jgi:hypothetical protein
VTKETASSVAEVAGALALIVGATLLSVAAGFLVGGSLALLFAWSTTR